MDFALSRATVIIERARAGAPLRPVVQAFFHGPTSTISYVVFDSVTRAAAIIDPVLDYDPAAGRTSYGSANAISAFVARERLSIGWLLETHVHADHLSAAAYLQDQLGGRVAIGCAITVVQDAFGKLFDAGPEFERDGSQFDRLFDDGDTFDIGGLHGAVLHLPGHTPADVAYVIGDAVFCGDTIFMPDYGTARADFPGGDPRRLFRSIRRLLSLPREARLFLCHDYKAAGREVSAWETTIGIECDANIHARDGVDEDAFVAMRSARDRELPAPHLLLPSVQVNMNAGRLPKPGANGTRYLKIPLDTI